MQVEKGKIYLQCGQERHNVPPTQHSRCVCAPRAAAALGVYEMPRVRGDGTRVQVRTVHQEALISVWT